MRIIKVETIRYAALPNLLWVQLYSDDGLVGLGETFYLPAAVESIIHDVTAGFILNRDDCSPESVWDQVFSYCNFFGHAGAEMRALSAVDIALWDLLGQTDWPANLSASWWQAERNDSHLQYLR